MPSVSGSTRFSHGAQTNRATSPRHSGYVCHQPTPRATNIPRKTPTHPLSPAQPPKQHDDGRHQHQSRECAKNSAQAQPEKILSSLHDSANDRGPERNQAERDRRPQRERIGDFVSAKSLR